MDATGDAVRVITFGRVRRGATLDFTVACERPSMIAVKATDTAENGPTLAAFELACEPGLPRWISAGWMETTGFVTIDAVVQPQGRFWVRLAVPHDDLLPPFRDDEAG